MIDIAAVNHNSKIDHKKSIWDITIGGGAYILTALEGSRNVLASLFGKLSR